MGLCLVALWTARALLWMQFYIIIYFCFIWGNQKIWERELIFFSLFIEFLIQLWATVFRFDGETSRIEERRKPSAVPTHVHDDPHEDGIYLLIIFNNISHNIKREIYTCVKSAVLYALFRGCLAIVIWDTIIQLSNLYCLERRVILLVG